MSGWRRGREPGVAASFPPVNRFGREIECVAYAERVMIPPTTVKPSLDLDLMLADLARLEHVQGGLVISPDGRVMAIHLPRELAVEPLAAMATTLGRDLELQEPPIRRGTFMMAHVATGDGTVFVCATPVGFIVLLADPEMNRKAVRHALIAAMQAVRPACA
jgi:predicted regulator of Ras-like GTPase activity (Roadblock/LC7/MglB family)